MTIGELARGPGVSIETVRYYERSGLRQPPPRTRSGHRQYAGNDLNRLKFIRHARAFGFTLRDIEELLTLRARPSASCDAVDRKARERVASVRATIRKLMAVQHDLEQLVRNCDARRSIAECPILHGLEVAERPYSEP